MLNITAVVDGYISGDYYLTNVTPIPPTTTTTTVPTTTTTTTTTTSTSTTITTTTTTTSTTTTTIGLAQISFDPDPKDFGAYRAPASDTRSFNIINSGDGPFFGAFSSFISGPNASYFTLLGSPYISVPANSYVNVDVSFNASKPGLYSAVFNLLGEDAPGIAASHTLDLFATIASSGGPTPINSCTTINSPGVYVLNQDLSSSGTCIRIESSDVVFDGAGYRITGSGSNTGIYVYSSGTTLANVTVRNTTVTGWQYGIYYRNVENGSITDNIANSNNYYGIYLSSSSHNTITDNTANYNIHLIIDEGYGIRLSSSSNNTLNNNIASNNWYGIILSSSSNNTIINNIASNNIFGILLSSSSNNTLNNNIASNNDGGIHLSSSSNNTLTNNIANFNLYEGISLVSSSYNTVENNIASSNDNLGIFLASSSYNTIINNIANSNGGDMIGFGIYLEVSCNYNTITNNTVNSNGDSGIRVYISSNNTITDNTVSGNGAEAGIWLYSSSNNIIYNNLFNNTNNFDLSSSTNDWNTTKTDGTNIVGGSYLGGNFWAKPDGTGFSETCTDANRDGICDSNYTLASGNVDYLPLAVVSTPPINISKVMTSGKTTVYTETKEYWVLEIEVVNDDLINLSNVVVSDTIPEEITLDDFMASKGSVATTVKNGATKLTWTIGAMSPGDTETLVMDVSTRTVGSGMRTTQHFLEPGEYVLNEGASVSGNGGQITAGPTDPIIIYAQTKTRRGRMGGERHSR